MHRQCGKSGEHSTSHAVTRGLVLGKFLPYHAGHAHLIRTARAQVDELTVLVCSIAREPIPGEVRFGWVVESHPDCRVVHATDEVPQAPDEHPDFWQIWTELVARYAGEVDVVFTSEPYGDRLAECLGARHVCVDPERRRYPVSGTAVRSDPLAMWELIPPVVRPAYVHRVAILGTESTGKSTMAEHLATTFDTLWVPEFGRAYCEGRDVWALTLADFDAIARGQIVDEEEAARCANRVLICDTDVRTTATWSELIRGEISPWLAHEAEVRGYSHVLLLSPDVPWVDDGSRVLHDERLRHTELLEAAPRDSGQAFTRIAGPFDARLRQAEAIVGDVLRSPVKPRFGATSAASAEPGS